MFVAVRLKGRCKYGAAARLAINRSFFVTTIFVDGRDAGKPSMHNTPQSTRDDWKIGRLCRSGCDDEDKGLVMNDSVAVVLGGRVFEVL